MRIVTLASQAVSLAVVLTICATPASISPLAGQAPVVDAPQTAATTAPLPAAEDTPPLVTVEDAPAPVHWKRGLVAWKAQDYDLAAAHFAAMAESQPPAPEASAAAFWAWRAYTRSGVTDRAATQLAQAALYPHTFYGLLARKALGRALPEAGNPPHLVPAGGFSLDPALIYAFAKQESNFNADAVGGGGAIGLMQLMPETARRMEHLSADNDERDASFAEPRTNLQLGQNYLRQLLKDSSVSGNLVYLAAAYNAGPGKLAQWRMHARAVADPLLFLETLPSSHTRFYVMQVLSNYWRYQEDSGFEAASAQALAAGSWPQYDAQTWRVAHAD